MSERTLPPEALNEWAAVLSEILDLGDEPLPIAQILDLTSVVAKAVARPAAPLSSFAAGLAAGRAGGSLADITAAVETIEARAREELAQQDGQA